MTQLADMSLEASSVPDVPNVEARVGEQTTWRDDGDEEDKMEGFLPLARASKP